jgi:hypothetical protein
MTVLTQAGALGRCGSISQEWELVRAVAQADGSVGRIVAGMRASESHLVRFHGARVHALLGGPDELLRDPWFGRDAIRTAADLGRHRRRRPRRRAERPAHVGASRPHVAGTAPA